MFEDSWECVDCGASYRTRPVRCGECGSPCFDPLDLPAPNRPTPPTGAPDDPDDSRWVCERCGRVHAFATSSCVACGAAVERRGPPRDVPDDPPPGFPTSPDAVRREAAARERDVPVDPREAAVVVLVCTVFVVLLTLHTAGLV